MENRRMSFPNGATLMPGSETLCSNTEARAWGEGSLPRPSPIRLVPATALESRVSQGTERDGREEPELLFPKHAPARVRRGVGTRREEWGGRARGTDVSSAPEAPD